MAFIYQCPASIAFFQDILDILYIERLHVNPSLNSPDSTETSTIENNKNQARDRHVNHVMSREYDVTSLVSAENKIRVVEHSANNPIKVLLMSKSRRFPMDDQYIEDVCGINYCQLSSDR